jgi:sporulation protein YlmC with PRC-barrel domain
MSHPRQALAGGVAFGLALAASSLFAQVQQETTTTTVQTQTGTTTTQIRTISSVIGSSVRLQDGGIYGKIEDIVIDDSGCVEYVVIANVDQYYVVPWSVAKVNYQERYITLNITQQDIRQVAFRRDEWRNVSYAQLSQKAQQVFGASTGGRARSDPDSRSTPGGGREKAETVDRGRPVDRPQTTEPDRPKVGDRPQGKGSDRPKDGDRPRDKDARPKADGQPKTKGAPQPNPNQPR